MKFISLFAVFLVCVGAFSSCVTTTTNTTDSRHSSQVNAPLFGHNGTRSTLSNNRTIGSQQNSQQHFVNGNEQNQMNQNSNVAHINPNTSVTSTQRNGVSSNQENQFGANDNARETGNQQNSSIQNTAQTTTQNTSQEPAIEERFGTWHPDNPDWIVNPYNPNGRPLKVRNLSNNRPDYQAGDRVIPDRDKPHQRVIIPD